MKIVLVHNDYGVFSGEERVVRQHVDLLASHEHRVIPFRRSSMDIPRMPLGRIRAFWGGIYNPFVRQEFRALLVRERPDLVHIHNLYPLISPSILPECTRAGVPVVMTVHNFRLLCPTGLFFSRGQLCERCRGGGAGWCVVRNCTGLWLKSLGYALRHEFARASDIFRKHVNVFLPLNHFQRQKLIVAGFPAERIHVLPNMVESLVRGPVAGGGHCVGFIGRLSPEKGVADLLAAARRLPHIPFVFAGDAASLNGLVLRAPDNVRFLGHIEGAALVSFWRSVRFIVLPSVCHEAFPMVVVEAMARGVPVVCSALGGLPEIVDDGGAGLLVRPGDPQDLAEKIEGLWRNPERARVFAENGLAKVEREYLASHYYLRLISIYQSLLLPHDASI